MRPMRKRTSKPPARKAAALMMALFVMSVTTALVVSILDTEMLQYASMRNTIEWDRARYLAEAGVQHALAELEADITWRAGVSNVPFPPGSGYTYSATAADDPSTPGNIIVTATGTAGATTRRLQTKVKQGG